VRACPNGRTGQLQVAFKEDPGVAIRLQTFERRCPGPLRHRNRECRQHQVRGLVRPAMRGSLEVRLVPRLHLQRYGDVAQRPWANHGQTMGTATKPQPAKRTPKGPLSRTFWSGRRDSNPRPSPWHTRAERSDAVSLASPSTTTIGRRVCKLHPGSGAHNEGPGVVQKRKHRPIRVGVRTFRPSRCDQRTSVALDAIRTFVIAFSTMLGDNLTTTRESRVPASGSSTNTTPAKDQNVKRSVRLVRLVP
jgi:hypothetical protein